MGKKGRNKGKRGEAEVVALLSEWLGIKLRRAPMSGAMWGYPSDVIPASSEDMSSFPFLIEVKFQEGWDLTSFVAGKDTVFRTWINQVEEELKRLKKPFCILFFRKSRVSWFVAIPRHQILNLENLNPYLCMGKWIITTFSNIAKYKPLEVFNGFQKNLGRESKNR